MQSRIAIIGAGNMGGSMYRALSPLHGPGQIVVADNNGEKLEALRVPATSGFTDAVEMLNTHKPDIILLCIKPQALDVFAATLSAGEEKPDLFPTLLVSVLAGTTIKRLQSVLHASRVVRAMPNLAAGVGASVTGWYASAECTDDDRKQAEEICSAFGTSIPLDNESMIDSIAAIAGCGPAYFFYLTQLLQEQAVAFGYSPDNAQRMAEQTLIGAAKVMVNGGRSAEEWKKAVTSKGGMTEAALKHMEDSGMKTIFKAAIERARDRAEEMAA